MTNRGLETVKSPYSVEETMDWLEKVLDANEATVFAKIDHSKNAATADLSLSDTIVFIFGAPQIGTLLMQEDRKVAIDLPSKILIWKNENEETMVTRNRTSWLKDRHNLKEDEACAILEEKIQRIVQDTIS